MLNCTARRQVEVIIYDFFDLWSDPTSFLKANDDDVSELISSLGFRNRRTKQLKSMTYDFIHTEWIHVTQLRGVGRYASRAWEMFCLGKIGNNPPGDHALDHYWNWVKERYEKRKERIDYSSTETTEERDETYT